jgi:hypothetical protein
VARFSLYIGLLLATFCTNAQFIMLKELLQHAVQIFVLTAYRTTHSSELLLILLRHRCNSR